MLKYRMFIPTVIIKGLSRKEGYNFEKTAVLVGIIGAGLLRQ